jgi:hypothetical protein
VIVHTIVDDALYVLDRRNAEQTHDNQRYVKLTDELVLLTPAPTR